MSLSAVALPATDVPGTVESTQRRDASTHAIGLQHPLPPAHHHMNHLPPHQIQHWAQPLNALHPPIAGRPYPLPLPLLRPEPVTLATLSSLLASSSPARPSPFLLSLRVGDEVDALDEIGYRQWRHAFILELGHIPGQTVHDSARIGEYKIRWAGWDAKWDEFVHGNRLAPLNSKVIGDTGPEALSEKESAHRIGREWRQARHNGQCTDVAITFQPDPDTTPPVHRRSLSSDDLPTAPLMLAHLALLSVRCPSLLSMFSDAPDDEAGDHPVSYQLHPQADSHIHPTPHPSTASAGPLESLAAPTALAPPTSARLHSDLDGGGWRRGRLSTPAGVRGGVIEVVAADSPRSARPSSANRPATADAATILREGVRAAAGGPHPHHSSSSSASTAPRRALNFSQVAPAVGGGPGRAISALPPATARVPVARGKAHLTPTVPSLSASAPTSPLTGTALAPLPPTLVNAPRTKADRWTASPVDEDVARDVGHALEAMTAAVEGVDAIQGRPPLDYGDSDDDGAGSAAAARGKEEKKEDGFIPLSDDDDPSPPHSAAATPAPAQLIPVFCVPGIRSYAALRAFVEFVYTDSFDASVQPPSTRPRPKSDTHDPPGLSPAPGDDRPRPRRPMREVGVGGGVGGEGGGGEDSDEERLGLMGDPELDGLEDELIHQAIAARYGRQLNAAATRALAQELDAGLRREAGLRAEAAAAVAGAAAAGGGEEGEVEPANPAHVLSMADLFDLACIGSRFHFPRLIALCASQLSDSLSVDNIMEALQHCVRVGCLGGEEEDILASIFSQSSSALLPPSSIAPPSSSSLPSHRVHDLSILLRIAFDFLSHHWDVVMKRDTSVKILHTLPFPAFSAVVQVKGRSVNSAHGSGRYTPPVVHHPASRLVRDIKQLYLQRGPPPSTPAGGSGAPLLVAGARTSADFPSASTFRFPACDFQIVVGDCVHWAHRSVLACRSEYFRALFSSRMQESCGASITFPLSQHSPDSVATLLRYLYFDDVSHISFEAALYLLHHCTDFFGLASNALEAACEQLIMQECEGAAASPSTSRPGGGADPSPDAERRVGLSDVVRMSWRMQKWPLFERAVKFLDWRGLDALISQTYATAPSPAMPSPSAARSPPTAASPPHPLYSARVGAGAGVGMEGQSEEKTNSDSLQLLSAQSTSSSAVSSPPHLAAAFDMELVRAIVAEKANPGWTMRERGGVSRGEEGSAVLSREDSRDHSRSDSLRVDGIGLLRRRREEEEEEEEEEEDGEVEEDLAGGEMDDGDLDDDDRRHDEDDDEDDLLRQL